VSARAPALDVLLADAEAGVRTRPPAETAAVRTMYKRVGLDPTKTRPGRMSRLSLTAEERTAILFELKATFGAQVTLAAAAPLHQVVADPRRTARQD
jgi:hypothetical protein